MYYALHYGWIDTHEMRFENVALDIETLNQEARKGTYDISAISFGLYPFIKDEYALLRTAISFGDGYGPKLIKCKGHTLKRRFKVALSGRYTTNAMLTRIYYPDARPVYMNFLEIEKAVLEGVVDAGVLIHESILDFDERLEVEKELWDIWVDLAGDQLPLPLGGMALRRSIPLHRAIAIERLLTEAVKVANERKKELCEKLQNDNLVRISDKMLEKYLDMYASDASIELDDTQLEALDRLYKIGFDYGMWRCPIQTRTMLLPIRYLQLRNR